MVGRRLTRQLSHLWCAVARHKRKSLAVFLTVVIFVGAFAIFAPKSYHCEGTLLIRPANGSVTFPTIAAGQGSVASVPVARASEVNSVVEILKSRAIAEKVVDLLGPDFIAGYSSAASGAASPSSPVDQIAGQLRKASIRSQGLLRRLEGTADPGDRDRAITRLSSQYTASSSPGSDLVRIECNGPSPQSGQKIVAAPWKSASRSIFDFTRRSVP